MEINAFIRGIAMKTIKSNQLGWVNGNWGPINELSIPICDRSLNFSDGIFETILIINGKAKLLNRHLQRWKASAEIMGMKSPPDIQWIKPLIDEGIKKACMEKENGSIRLNWSRGDAIDRGIDFKTLKKLKHRFWLIINRGEPIFNPISTIVSKYEKRNSDSELSRCKTFSYIQSIKCKIEAHEEGVEEALLKSTNNEICCGSNANLIIKRKDQLLTPSINSGCLPGIMREVAIETGLLKEASLTCNPEKNDQWFLINSLGCRPIKSVNNIKLDIYPKARSFWESLLSK